MAPVEHPEYIDRGIERPDGSPLTGPPAASLTYTIPEAAAALRISTPSMRRRITEGVFPTVRIGGRVLIPRRALEDWVRSNTRATA